MDDLMKLNLVAIQMDTGQQEARKNLIKEKKKQQKEIREKIKSNGKMGDLSTGQNKYLMKIMSQSVLKIDGIDDLFQENVDQDEERKKLMDNELKRALLKQNVDITEIKIHINKLLMITRLQLVAGPVYIMALLELIKFVKLSFSLEIEQGKETPIPI